MSARPITTFRLLSAARRWPASSREAFVRAFAGGRPGLAEEVLGLLASETPETGFLAPPLPVREGETTLGPGGARAPGDPLAPPGPLAGLEAGGPGAADPSSWVARRVLSRYRLKRVLARGGAGTVYEAEDEVLKATVAVKVLHRPLLGRPAALAHVRREVACLRLLRLPGVVQLHDDGIEDDRFVLAMDLVEGVPFPGAESVVAWRQIAMPTLALVETMARVHALGVVHGDLKPLNVLVTREGRPVVLDLGVSGGPAIDVARERSGPVGATARYMSPEHARGDPVGPAADLYAIGLMVFEALSGRRPHEARDLGELHDQRRSRRAPPLRAVAPEVDPSVAAWVDALLEPDPAVRQRASEAALAHVPGHVDLPARVAALRDGGTPGPVARDVVEALFTGPRRLHHIPEDAAQALLVRTDGSPAAIVSELVAWVRAGFARWDGDGVAIDRPSLERLRLGQTAPRTAPLSGVPTAGSSPGGPAVRLFELIASGQLERVPEEAERLGSAEADLGSSDAAQQLYDAGIRAAQALGRAHAAERLLAQAVDCALDQGTAAAFDVLLYRLALMPGPSPRLRRLEGVVRAALTLIQGEPERAEAMLGACGAEDDTDPLLVRSALRVRARCGEGRSPVEHERVVSEVSARVARWPGDRSGFESDAWTGWLRYRQGRYEEAAALFLSASTSASRRIRRAAHVLRAGASSLEIYELDAAEARAGQTLELLSGARHPLIEAIALRLLRAVAYRRERAETPDVDLVRATHGLPPAARVAVACTEAAFAWRAGDSALGLSLVVPVITAQLDRAVPQFHAHMSAFRFALGGDLDGETADELTARVVRTALFPGVLVQSLGCIASRAPALVRPHHALLREHAARIPRGQWKLRREVTSVTEALASAGLDDVG